MLFCQCCTSVVLSMFHWCCFVCVSLVFFLVAVCASPVLFYLCCTSGFFLCSTSVVLSVSLVLFWLWVLVLFWLCSNSVVLSVLLVVVFFCISLVFFLSVFHWWCFVYVLLVLSFHIGNCCEVPYWRVKLQSKDIFLYVITTVGGGFFAMRRWFWTCFYLFFL